MTVAVVVICPADIHADAVEWGNAGLVADSFWVSSDDAVDVDRDRPNSIQAQRITSQGIRQPAPLAESLADLGPLDEVRVAWVRPPDAQLSQSLKSLEQLLRELLPSDANRWLDIVVPTRRTDRTVVPLPGQWVQLRIHPEDRSAPDVTDAGWDLDLDVPLHTALVATGTLGGMFSEAPWAQASAANHYDIRTFSRLVLGAHDTGPAADRFLSQVMPAASASLFFPDLYLEVEGAKAEALVDEAVTYMLGAGSGALAYADPAPSEFTPPPKLSVWQHILILFRFLGYSLSRLVGITPGRHALGRSRFQFDDLGHKIDTKQPENFPSLSPADFDALDDRAAEQARKELDELAHELKKQPPELSPVIWRTLIQIVTALNDGGNAPDGWDAPMDHELRQVLTPSWVQPADSGEAVEALAASDARRGRNPALAVLRDSTGAVRTAQELAQDGNAHDRQRLQVQLESLEAPAGRRPVSFLDRLGGRIVGAGRRAQFDAERWAEFATDPTEHDAVDWRARERTFRRRTAAGAAGGAAVAVVWWLLAHFLRAHLPSWLNMPVGFVVVGCGVAGFLLWNFYLFFKQYSAYLERGRRRLELRRIWVERASVAMREAARLAEGGAVYEKWAAILGAIFPFDTRRGAPPERKMPARAPKCMSVAVPVYTERELTGWFADGMRVGWRRAAFDSMAAEALQVTSVDAVKRLVEDHGLKGGPLHRMWECRDELWRTYVESLRFTSTGDIAACMVESDSRPVSLITAPNGPRSEMPLKDFRTEPWPPTDDDAADWTDGFTLRTSRSKLHSEHAVDLNSDVCLMAVRVQLRICDPATVSATADESVMFEDNGTY